MRYISTSQEIFERNIYKLIAYDLCGYPPLPEGITLRTKERRAMPMYVTYADLIQVGIFIVALIGLCYAIAKGKEK